MVWKRSKYNSRKVVIDGNKFDSEREALRYRALKKMEQEGKIAQLELQPRFELQSEFVYKGQKMNKIEYIADFKYLDYERGGLVVEDVKGVKTTVYKLKKKLFLAKYGNGLIFEEV